MKGIPIAIVYRIITFRENLEIFKIATIVNELAANRRGLVHVSQNPQKNK